MKNTPKLTNSRAKSSQKKKENNFDNFRLEMREHGSEMFISESSTNN